MKVLLIVFTLVIKSSTSLAQQAVLSNGGEANGLGGTASFSIGQVFDAAISNSNFSIQEGVQQVYKINTDGLLVIENEFLSIYPIPSFEYLNIELKTTDSEFEYQVISLDGSLVYKGALHSPFSTINLDYLKTGEYYIVLKTYKQIFKSKIIKA